MAEVCTAHGVRKADAGSGPVPADGRPRQLEHVIGLAAAGIAALLLVAVAVDASRTILDATSAGSPPLRFLLAAVISCPCLYGAYRMARMARMALPFLHLGAAGEPVHSRAAAGTK